VSARLALSILTFAHAIEAQRERRRDSDGTATAAINEDLSVPQDCQARAEGIAHNPDKSAA
jgi:hypothetical protein